MVLPLPAAGLPRGDASYSLSEEGRVVEGLTAAFDFERLLLAADGFPPAGQGGSSSMPWQGATAEHITRQQ
jgi:hypothetical protein